MLLTKVLNYITLQCFVELCNELDCTETVKLWFLKCRMQPNRGAMHRWILGQEERAAIMRQCETMASVSDIPRLVNT